jgi:hypothetical protein
MVIALSMIGVKSYRDNYRGGVINFGKGLQVGLLITLIASLIYAAAGETYFGQTCFLETKCVRPRGSTDS